MTKIQKSTNLYKTPFTISYWRDAAAELKDVPGIVYANDGINTCKIGKNGESLSYMIDILHCPRRTENV